MTVEIGQDKDYYLPQLTDDVLFHLITSDDTGLASMDDDDHLVPDPKVWRMFGVTPMTGYRWTNDKDLGFPPTIKVKTRNYRSCRALDEFKARLISEAMNNRPNPGIVAMQEARRMKQRERAVRRHKR